MVNPAAKSTMNQAAVALLLPDHCGRKGICQGGQGRPQPHVQVMTGDWQLVYICRSAHGRTQLLVHRDLASTPLEPLLLENLVKLLSAFLIEVDSFVPWVRHMQLRLVSTLPLQLQVLPRIFALVDLCVQVM